MPKDDISLGVEMGRLEIEPGKLNKPIKEENPFVHVSELQQRRSIFTRTSTQYVKCPCSVQKKSKHVAICKKKQNRILREPVLKLLKSHTQNCNVKEECQESTSITCPTSSLYVNSDNFSLCALVDNCNQLRISSGHVTSRNISKPEQNTETQWWTPNVMSMRQGRNNVPGKGQVGSCSQQALNPSCDVTIDELASYFETLVHIPKKMSSMAEMMYI